ncbi:SpoIIE family protein phosphatase [Candidatus Peregrinibacteria bacterium]|nr:SpoIIE family protein phosphatase [Candidatus Peregrinibacteria bacterium]
MRTLRAKLILGISIFVVILFVITAFLQVREKEKELINDILVRARSFAELTSDRIAEDYKLYLVPNSFIYFNRDIQDILAKNEDIDYLKIVDYQGEILFDSNTDKDAKYQGNSRVVENQNLLAQIQSKNLSVKPLNQQSIIYYKKLVDDSGAVSYQSVNANEQSVDGLKTDQRIEYLVAPANEQFSVIFGISYEALATRVRATQFRILLLGVFGVAIGMVLAIIFGSTITKPLHKLKKGAEILATGDLTYRVQVNTKDEIFDLAQTFNNMAAELQESTKALVYKERVGKELELAKQIQKRILPKTVPNIKGLDICAGIIPAEEIGGDCYDFLTPNPNSLVFYLGDVTGHGVPSGIIVSIANALFYSFAERAELNEIINDVNDVLKEKSPPNMFVTLVLMKWLADLEKFSYVSAGHEQIIHYKAAEDVIELLPSGGLALGMIKDVSKLLKVRDVDLGKGDVLFVYSDGIPEAWRNEHEMYGMERLKAMVKDYAKFPTALAIRNALMADVYMFRQGYKQMDDITCIVIKRV